MSHRILIVKTSSLGDITQCFPVISYLKNRFPHCTIDWVVENRFSSLVENHPQIDRSLLINTHSWRRSPFSKKTRNEFKQFKEDLQKTEYDFLFDLQGNTKSAMVTFLSKAKRKIGFSFRSAPEKINPLFLTKRYHPYSLGNIRQDYLSIVQQQFNDTSPFSDTRTALICSPEEEKQLQQLLSLPLLQNRRRILICPAARWPNKQLSIASLQQLMLHLSHQQPTTFIITWGTTDEQTIANKLSKEFDHSLVAPKLPFPSLQNLMEASDLIIAMDSFPLHLAATTSTSTWSFFGPSSKTKYAPPGKQHKSIQGSCPYEISFKKRCPKLRSCSTGNCMKQLNGTALYQQLTVTPNFSTDA